MAEGLLRVGGEWGCIEDAILCALMWDRYDWAGCY
jgi:hypothetical protein